MINYDKFIDDKRMWAIYGAATGYIPMEKIGEMTPYEQGFFDDVKKNYEKYKASGEHYTYDMPSEYGD